MNFGAGNLSLETSWDISGAKPNYASNRAACCSACDLAKSTKISV